MKLDKSAEASVEKPRNGVAGLKHWRHDIVAGLLVSLISVPFSLGIAVASGAPPVCGLISAIIAGLVLPFLGGSYVTISGPAAGLAPALLAAMTLLGRNNLERGYPLLLVAICLTGCVQIVLSRLKAARASSAFPSAVVEGMLAAIGMMIIAKQLPHLVGRPFAAHEFFGILAETPSQLRAMNPKLFILGISSLVLIFLIAAAKARWLKALPPQVIVVAIGIVLGLLIGVESRYLINIPAEPFKHGIVLPNFAGVWNDRTLWWSVFTVVLTLTLIDGVESLATVKAIDKIDPFRRKSDPDRTLTAMGVSNICSSLAGGLTIIPGGVKSTACIVAGGRTQWANFYNAIFLIVYLLIGRGVINLIPLSVLSAVLIYTGYKLCKPAVWRHMAHVGIEQVILFGFTVIVTLSTDLLWGIFAGLGLKLLIAQMMSARGALEAQGRRATPLAVLARFGGIVDLFRNPVIRRESRDGAYYLELGRPVVCFNALHLTRELDRVPDDANEVVLHVGNGVSVIDHTSCENLIHFAEEFERAGRGHVEIDGLDRMHALSGHAAAMRLAAPAPVAVVEPAGLALAAEPGGAYLRPEGAHGLAHQPAPPPAAVHHDGPVEYLPEAFESVPGGPPSISQTID
jgi:MFS superfamily sulfate permease-like transporter